MCRSKIENACSRALQQHLHQEGVEVEHQWHPDWLMPTISNYCRAKWRLMWRWPWLQYDWNEEDVRAQHPRWVTRLGVTRAVCMLFIKAILYLCCKCYKRFFLIRGAIFYLISPATPVGVGLNRYVDKLQCLACSLVLHLLVMITLNAYT